MLTTIYFYKQNSLNKINIITQSLFKSKFSTFD